MIGSLFLFPACRHRTTPDVAAGPTVVLVDTDEVDIGEIYPGTSHRVEYKLCNSGNNKLHINAVLPSCDCTQATFDKKDAAPGECITVVLTYRAEDFSGVFYREAEVDCNTEEPVILTLTGTITSK